jgi:hypothetical protein
MVKWGGNCCYELRFGIPFTGILIRKNFKHENTFSTNFAWVTNRGSARRLHAAIARTTSTGNHATCARSDHRYTITRDFDPHRADDTYLHTDTHPCDATPLSPRLNGSKLGMS